VLSVGCQPHIPHISRTPPSSPLTLKMRAQRRSEHTRDEPIANARTTRTRVRCIGCAALRTHYFQSLRLPRRRLLLLLLSTDASSASTAVPMLLAVAAAATGFLSCCARLLLLTATLGAVTPNIARATLTADGIFFVR
jgi:hypothetical protein